MIPIIDKIKTGRQIRRLMEIRGITVKDVQTALSLGCVQSVYHWRDGQSMPTLDNLYALSELLKVPMDLIICGNRQYDPIKNITTGSNRIICYYRMLRNNVAA